MSEWCWWAIGSAFALAAAVQFIGALRCAIELRRHWRSAGELWGIDWLDIVWRLEREFGLKLTAADFAELSAEERAALTAGQLWKIVAARIRNHDELPDDGWERMVAAVAESLNVGAERITPDARLHADLGMVNGCD